MKFGLIFFILVLLPSWVFLDREPGALRAVRDMERFKQQVQTL